MSSGKEESGDVEEMREIFSVLSKEVPSLLRSLIDPLKELLEIIYNPERTRERAKAIASFYKELKDQGLPENLIIELIREEFVNPFKLLKEFFVSEHEEEK